jgi:hypothetical protein
MSTETSRREYYKTEIGITVLSEEPIPEGMGLPDTIREADQGGYVLNETKRESMAISGAQAAVELDLAGSEPSFFGLDVDGSLLDQDRKAMSIENQDWLDELSEREVNHMVSRVIDEDRITSESLRRLLRETGIAEEEDPAAEED